MSPVRGQPSRQWTILTEATLLNKIKDNDFLHFGTAKQKNQEFVNRYPDLR